MPCYALRVLKLFIAPPTNDRGPRHMERVFAGIHQSRLHEPLTLHFANVENRGGLLLEFDDTDEALVCSPIMAHYPNCQLTTIAAFDSLTDAKSVHVHLQLQPELFPILRFAQFEDALTRTYADPITGLLRAVVGATGINPRISMIVSPGRERIVHRAEKAVIMLDREFFRHRHRLADWYARHAVRGSARFLAKALSWLASATPHPPRTMLDTSTGRQHDREDDLQSAAAKVGGHVFEVRIRLTVEYAHGFDHAAGERLRQMIGAFGAFTEPRLAVFTRSRRPRRGLMAHDELATLFHAPTASVATDGLQTAEFRELEPPPRFHQEGEAGCLALGRIRHRDDQRTFALDSTAQLRHIYCIGATGTGKSTLLLNLIQQTVQAGRGLTVIDVHGDLADAALALVPAGRTNDVIAFDAAGDSVVPFNPLACPDPAAVDHVVSGVVSAFRKLFDSWGPRLEALLRFSIFVAVERQGTLIDVLRLLTDKAFRDRVVAGVQDDIVRSFWLNEFTSWNSQYRTEAVSSVTNKLAPALASRKLRAVLASPGPRSLDIRGVLDTGRILIANVSRGRLGQDHSTLLGSLLLTSIEQAALSRADRPEVNRRPHTLFLDEFQSLITPSTAILLSESRKYALGLVLSHQFTSQLDPATMHAVIGNCGTLVTLRIGLEDAQALSPAFCQFEGQVSPADFCNLPNHTAYVRALIDGHPSRPFSLNTMPPPQGDPERAATVRRTSTRQYGQTASQTANATHKSGAAEAILAPW